MAVADSFGVVIIGDEILSGKRRDRHLEHVIDALAARGAQVAWSRVTGDGYRGLVHTLRQTQQDGVPVFCFGGIGATPDDRTRAAAAAAFGCRLVRHPDALALIEAEFGDAAFPVRVRMADLPEDCRLIPNVQNRVPGFTLYDHHFFPGFTDLAWLMLDWVLDTYYPAHAGVLLERSIRVMDVAESALVPLLEELHGRLAGVKLFSLPHLGAVNSVEIGVRGRPDAVEASFAELTRALESYVLDDTPGTSSASLQSDPLSCRCV
jgi:molybdopterin-biosynthesis enzyme MoeA-like protein